MTLARIAGRVVSSKSSAEIPGAVWRIVEICDHHGRPGGDTLIALDTLGAAEDDLVLLCRGSSVRWTRRTAEKPVDALVAALVDIIDEGGRLTYRR